MDRSRVAIVIPAFNEEATIARVVTDTGQYGHVIVVDDASTDETGSIAERAGALVIRNSKNLQYDGSLGVGLQTALDHGYEFALTLDADGQHPAGDIPKFLMALEQGADLVLGIRPSPARFAERCFRVMGRLLWGVEDPLCGMKAYRMSWLKHYGVADTYRSIGTQQTISALRAGARMQQIPITIHARNDRSRFGGIVRANLRITRALAISVWRYGLRH